MYIIWTVFIAFLGLCIGSFLNVCIWRLPRGESVVFPPSHCPKCDKLISWYENIPLLSWLALRGRCSKCHNPISARYFCVELLTGLMFLAVWFKVNSLSLPEELLIPLLAADFILVIFIVLTIFIDLDHLIIPNKITYPVIVFGLALSLYAPALWPLSHGSRWVAFTLSCASFLVAGGALAIFAVLGKKIFKKDALGWGDVKYIAAIATVLGPWAAFFTILIGSILGSVVGLILIAVKKKGLSSGIPFGPPLAIATFIWILCGSEILQAYFEFTAKLAS
jgi:leader peptidase (prepilin peptidase)/N-methyltransferase